MPTDTALLGEVPWFEQLTEDERSALAAVLDVDRFEAGQTIFRYGDPGDALYVIRTGEVELSIKDDTGTTIVLEVAREGDFFGEVSLLDPGPRTATAKVLTATVALRLDRDDLEKFLRTRPTAAVEMLSVLGRRLRTGNVALRRTASRNVNEEIADTRSVIQRAADWIAEFSGSITFLALNALWFFTWISLNLGALPFVRPFDPYPFGFLTMVVSLEAIFLSIFVLISQNRQAAKDRVRADIEYNVNLKAELEVAHLHEKFDHLHAELQARLAKIERVAAPPPVSETSSRTG